MAARCHGFRPRWNWKPRKFARGSALRGCAVTSSLGSPALAAFIRSGWSLHGISGCHATPPPYRARRPLRPAYSIELLRRRVFERARPNGVMVSSVIGMVSRLQWSTTGRSNPEEIFLTKRHSLASIGCRAQSDSRCGKLVWPAAIVCGLAEADSANRSLHTMQGGELPPTVAPRGCCGHPPGWGGCLAAPRVAASG
jgi:hypothetical protein